MVVVGRKRKRNWSWGGGGLVASGTNAMRSTYWGQWGAPSVQACDDDMEATDEVRVSVR